jgi:hypothetical protein
MRNVILVLLAGILIWLAYPLVERLVVTRGEPQEEQPGRLDLPPVFEEEPLPSRRDSLSMHRQRPVGASPTSTPAGEGGGIMGRTIQAVRGMNDIGPEQTAYWQYLEETLRRVIQAYGYREIRLPLLEKTELFKRSIGEVTDIVEKEMYTFDDRSGDSLTLRPEGTAGCVRACIEHGLLHNQVQRLWYAGPMFRHERPQKGRYRQFHQFGVEAFGMEGPDIDAEMIFLTARMWKALGLSGAGLQINSLGTAASRAPTGGAGRLFPGLFVEPG